MYWAILLTLIQKYTYWPFTLYRDNNRSNQLAPPWRLMDMGHWTLRAVVHFINIWSPLKWFLSLFWNFANCTYYITPCIYYRFLGYQKSKQQVSLIDIATSLNTTRVHWFGMISRISEWVSELLHLKIRFPIYGTASPNVGQTHKETPNRVRIFCLILYDMNETIFIYNTKKLLHKNQFTLLCRGQSIAIEALYSSQRYELIKK